MSTLVMSACWPLQMPPTPKAVLISLADNANDHGECWPSLTKIAERTCFGRTAVIEAIKWLEAAGLVVANRTDRYRTTYVVKTEGYDPKKVVREANQSARRTSSDGGGLVRLADDEVRETDDEVRQADTNHQEPSRTVSKATTKKRASAPTTPCPDDVDSQVWTDWLALRKAKRAPVTATVIDGAREEAAKADLTLTAFLRVWCRRGSQGLEASWLKPNERGSPTGQKNAQPTSKTRSAIEVLQGMKHANRVDPRRNHGRTEQAALPGAGPHAGNGSDSGDGYGVG